MLSCVVISGTEKGRERKREKREDREDGEWKVISLTEEKRKKGERKRVKAGNIKKREMGRTAGRVMKGAKRGSKKRRVNEVHKA